jgi:hypothetical protein
MFELVKSLCFLVPISVASEFFMANEQVESCPKIGGTNAWPLPREIHELGRFGGAMSGGPPGSAQ